MSWRKKDGDTDPMPAVGRLIGPVTTELSIMNEHLPSLAGWSGVMIDALGLFSMGVIYGADELFRQPWSSVGLAAIAGLRVITGAEVADWLTDHFSDDGK